MKDEHVTTGANLTKAQAAISYFLQRMRLDANLRHYMLHTEAYHRLCEAEAERTGESVETVEDRFSVPAEHCRKDRAEIVEARKAISALLDAIHAHKSGLPEPVQEALDALAHHAD